MVILVWIVVCGVCLYMIVVYEWWWCRVGDVVGLCVFCMCSFRRVVWLC